MVHFMAFSCKTGSIDRCLGLDVSAPSRWASGSVVTPAQDHFSKNVFDFHLPPFNLFPFSIMAASAVMCPLPQTHMNLWMWGRRRG